MNSRSGLFIELPELSDEMASTILGFLYELTTAFENHYANQLRRYHQPCDASQPDLFEGFDGELPPF